MPGFLQNLLLLVLIFALVFNVGCASSLTHAADTGGSSVVDSPSGGGLAQVSDGARVAAYALVGFLITVTFTLDLLILIATRRDPFPCCRAVIGLCH